MSEPVGVMISTDSNSLLDALELILFDYSGRVQTRDDVKGFVEEVQEILSKWQAEKAKKDAKRRADLAAFQVKRQMETAAQGGEQQ